MDDAQARGELLEALRVSRGLTQTQLAKASKISQAVISKAESGEDLDDDRWQTLAQVLAVPTDVFSSVRHSAAPARIFHRKRKTTPQAAVNKVAAELALVRLRLRGLVERPPVRLRLHDLEDGFVTPQEVAQLVRADLNLGTGPLEDLVGVLEAAGVVILRWPLESVHVDAIASWQQGEVPIILVGEHVPPDRQRFTMAHELGHAVMHETEATASQEAEADAFAGEFLLPAARLVQEWVPAPTLNDLLALKRRWRISLAALIRRARDVDLLSEDDYRLWSIQLSSTGMHRREPEPSQRENPTALAASIREAVDAGVSVDELAARAYMYPFEFELTFMQEDA